MYGYIKTIPHFIYALCDPLTDEIKYIGVSCSLGKRMRSHLRPSQGRGTSKNEWLKLLKKQGVKPKFIILDKKENRKEAILAERTHISTHNPEFNKNNKIKPEKMKAVKRSKEKILSVRLVIKMTSELRESVEIAAKNDHRSISDWGRLTLEKAIQSANN